jgi:outer membrane lipoprotein-sorting protein
VIAMNKSTRWIPAVVAPVLIAAAAIAVPAVASAASALPPKTAEQVLSLIANSHDAHYSGTVQQASNLGLPQLPSVGPGSSGADSSSANTSAVSTVLDLLTAPHTARVFVDGTSKQRLQVLDSLAERDVIRNGKDVWTYDSKQNAATHVILPTRSAAAKSDAGSTTPSALAHKFVAAIQPSTKLTVDRSASVAGRSTYQLTLAPKGASTLVSSVTLSVDSKTGLPLKVVVLAHGQKDAAFSIGFSSIDFGTPSAKTFEFTPPKGATVTTKSVDGSRQARPAEPADPNGSRQARPAKPAGATVTGTGWGSIVELPIGTAGSKVGGDTALLDQLSTPVAGGRALQTSLISVLLTSDGRVFAGAVPISTLEAAAQ